METKLAWDKYNSEDLSNLNQLNDKYIDFMSENKTERECVTAFIEMAKEHGYVDLEELIKNNTPLKAGDKVYAQIMGKTLLTFLIGEEPLENGMNLLGAHLDSPRIDLKQNPLYEDSDLAMMKTFNPLVRLATKYGEFKSAGAMNELGKIMANDNAVEALVALGKTNPQSKKAIEITLDIINSVSPTLERLQRQEYLQSLSQPQPPLE